MRKDRSWHGAVTITLSERNLRSLLSKLDDPDSNRALMSGYPTGDEDDPYPFVVVAEHDEVHYADRLPGVMSAKTEGDLLGNH